MMVTTAVAVCCKCGSLKIDVRYWKDRQTCVVRCAECGNEADLQGFTLGRVNINNQQRCEVLEDAAFPRAM
jgi:hypothetical protein